MKNSSGLNTVKGHKLLTWTVALLKLHWPRTATRVLDVQAYKEGCDSLKHNPGK